MWLGAGFSHAATANELPLMKGFFDQLNAARFAELHSFISARGAIDEANVESIIAELDELEEYPLGKGSPPTLRSDIDYRTVRSQLDEYTIHRLCKSNFSPRHWAIEVLLYGGHCATVVTTNYDNLAERVLSSIEGRLHRSACADCHHCRMCAILEEECTCTPAVQAPTDPWRGSLLKLHGSITWQVCYQPNCQSFECLIPDTRCRSYDNRACQCCGGTTSPVLVQPSARKQYRRFPKLHRMWDAAAVALTRAEDIVVFGYSFPHSDAHIQRLFRDAVAANDSLQAIIVIDVNPDGVISRLRPLCPSGRDIEITARAVPTDGSVPAWWIEERKSIEAHIAN